MEFLSVPGAWNVRETSEDIVCIIATYQLSDPYYILLFPLRILKVSEMREVDALWRFFSLLKDGWTMQG